MNKWEQMVFPGNPEYGCDLHPIDLEPLSPACGGVRMTIEDPTDCGRVVEPPSNTPGPAIVLAVVDPFEPPIGPKATLKQAADLAESLLRSEPNREKTIATILRDKAREII